MELRWNDDVLEKIFQFLDFKSLCAAELTCRQWHDIINDRRLFWQLSKSLSAVAVPRLIFLAKDEKNVFNIEDFRKERRKILRSTPYKPFGKRK